MDFSFLNLIFGYCHLYLWQRNFFNRVIWPYRWCDIADKFPGRERSALCPAFYWFLDFLIYNWAHLLLNNVNFWLPYFLLCAQAIRNKLATLPNLTYRQNFQNADQPGGFAVSFFIDNTTVAMCLPGTIIAYPLTVNDLLLLLRRRPNYRRWTGRKSSKGSSASVVDGLEEATGLEIANRRYA